MAKDESYLEFTKRKNDEAPKTNRIAVWMSRVMWLMIAALCASACIWGNWK